VALAVWGSYGHLKSTRYEKARLEAAAESQRIVRALEAKKLEAARKVDEEHVKKQRALQMRLDSIATDNAGLQQLISTNSIDSTNAIAVCGPDGERGRILERLLAESTDLVAEGAAGIARLANKTTALQDYIDRVCLSK
jgi:hypothetical protein